MRKYILSLLIAIVVLVIMPQDIRSSTINYDRFYNYNVITEIANLRNTQKEVVSLALNIYHEARGSTYEDKRAVAEVTMNRVRSGKFGNSVFEVVYQPKQFSWTFLIKNKKPRERFAWIECQQIAYEVYTSSQNEIVDNNVYHYVRHDIVNNVWWAKHYKERKRIGAHVYLS